MRFEELSLSEMVVAVQERARRGARPLTLDCDRQITDREVDAAIREEVVFARRRKRTAPLTGVVTTRS